MKYKDKYKGKKISVLGDSISTLAGYSQPRGAEYYTYERALATGVVFPRNTWWGEVINYLGGELLVNDSFSGSTVIKHKSYTIPSYGASDERTSALSDGGVAPDLIMVFIGTNDWGMSARVRPEAPDEEADLGVFSVAYGTMIRKLKANYPEAEIWCITPAVASAWQVKNYYLKGKNIDAFRLVIEETAAELGCNLIDLSGMGDYATVDSHPTAEGMATIARAIIDRLEAEPLENI